jgi:hypothetical protein
MTLEAQIICSAPCDIPDLGIYGLKRGEERWVSDVVASRSQDLVKECGKGNVRVYRKSRKMVPPPRRPPPPFVARSRPSGERPDVQVARQEPAEGKVIEKIIERVVEVSTPMDTEALARQVKAEILGDLLPGIRAVVQEEMGKTGSGIDAGQLENVLESVLRRVMPAGGVGGGTSRTPARRSPEADEPLFIPTALVDKDAKSRISVKTETGGESESLDGAQELLREMKRRRGDGKTDADEEK